jgi:hypothetical protein
MRASLWIASGLLVTNLALVNFSRRESAPHTPQVEPLIVEPQIPEHRVAKDTAETQRLQWFWQAKHSAFAPPKCEQYDPLATLDADIDPSPGREHVIGNRRFGVAMYAESGTLLAHMEPVGCASPAHGDQSLSLSFDRYLIVRTRQIEQDGEHLDAHVVVRRDDELHTLLTLDVGGTRADASREWQVEGRLYFRGDEVLVKHHGRQRWPGREWEEVDDHCTWQLATRSSSCRTRAGERTPESE